MQLNNIKEALLSFLGFPFSLVCYIGLCACKWSAKAKIPVFPSEISDRGWKEVLQHRQYEKNVFILDSDSSADFRDSWLDSDSRTDWRDSDLDSWILAHDDLDSDSWIFPPTMTRTRLVHWRSDLDSDSDSSKFSMESDVLYPGVCTPLFQSKDV